MGGQQSPGVSRGALLDAVRAGVWTGHANQLSEDHVQWTFIDEIAAATRAPVVRPSCSSRLRAPRFRLLAPGASAEKSAGARQPPIPPRSQLQRRSAVALDGRSPIDADRFFAMLSRVMPGDGAPWDAVWWSARIHLALFVHRVDGVEPGLHLLPRRAEAADALRAAMKRDFLWEPATDALPLIRLARGDRRLARGARQLRSGHRRRWILQPRHARRLRRQPGGILVRRSTVSCSGSRGVIGQVLYLEAEAAGARGTGIGCFYDDPVHDVRWASPATRSRSLYHFTIGMPIEDTRLTTEPGYAWER